MKLQMRLQKLTLSYRLLSLITLLGVLTVLTGCGSSRLVIYPIRNTDIRVENDEVIMSKWYFENVLKVKLEEGR